MKKTILCTVLLLISAISVLAQNITVHGTVISATPAGQAAKGVATDFDGKFEISVPEGTELRVTYIGFKEKIVKAQSEMTIVLEENSEVLEEVVVVGYQTQRKADLTGSVSVVSTKSLKTSPDTDPMRALQGKVPGMTVSANGSPSGTGTVRIRGIGSFNASQDPLFVIDYRNPQLSEHERYRVDAGAQGRRLGLNLRLACRQRCDHHHHQERKGRSGRQDKG